MLYEILGWSCTILVLSGYAFNSIGKYNIALISWIVGDIGWIVYDVYIENISHLVLSTVIIIINVYGIYRIRIKNKKC
jgi:hypothetical protein